MWSGQAAFLAALLCAGCAWGQANAGFGTVNGIIQDPNKQGIPDTTVVLANESLGTEHEMNTTDDGVFNAPTVIPAAGYKLKVSRKNFASFESPEFEVSTGQKRDFLITLEPEENTGKAEARGGLRPVDDIKSGLSTVISSQQLETTPASDLRLDRFIPLAPAVTQAQSRPGLWVYHAVPASNLSLTDGLLTTDMYFRQKQAVANQLPLNSVQGFLVASATFSAEFGGTMGGIVDAASRSGTTAYHGEAYEYYRSRSFQAEDRYAAGHDLRQQQHQAGADVGGPIRADTIFFFANFDWLDRSGEGLNRITNPLIANASGTAVLASNCHATAAQCAVATRFLQSQMNVITPLYDHSIRGLAKIDYRRSDRNSFSFEGNAMNWHAPTLAETTDVAPNGGLLGDPTLRERTRYAKAGWTLSGSSQITNDFRAGWFQDRITEYPSPAGLSTGLLGISIAGTVVGTPWSYSSILPSEHRAELSDSGNWTLGSHSIKVGADFQRTADYVNSLSNAAGWYDYPSLTTFAQDFGLTGQKNYTAFTQTLGNAVRNIHSRAWAFYAEDTWRTTSHLTIDYALRYDRPVLPKPPAANTSFYQTGVINAPWLNLSPRVGVAYTVKERTVIRAGFGFYYSPFAGQLLDALYLGNALNQTSISVNPNYAGAPVFPNVVKATSSVPNGTTNVAYIQSTFKNEYAQQASLSIERRITSDTSVTLSGLHVRGMRLWTTQDANLVPATQNETYTIDNAAGQAAGSYSTLLWTQKVNGNFGHAYQIENGGSSWYNAIALQVHKRMAHGLSLDASYTWSHATDNIGQTALFGTAISSSVNATYNSDKGTSAFDQRHHAAIQWLWEPHVGGGSSATQHAVNGWRLSTMTTLASSQYVTPMVSVEGQQFSGITMTYTNSLNGSGGWARVPFLPINSLPLGPRYDVDARLARTFGITERIKLTLLFEAFNAFNTQYNTSVNTLAYLSTSPLPVGVGNGVRTGVLQPVPGVGNGNAAGGFPDGTNARRAQAAVKIIF